MGTIVANLMILSSLDMNILTRIVVLLIRWVHDRKRREDLTMADDTEKVEKKEDDTTETK